MVEFKRGKHVKPSCKKLSDETLFTDFNTTSEDETTINSTRNTVENKTPVEEFINEWKEQHHTIVRNKNKEKKKEMMEKKWVNISYHHPNNKKTLTQVQCSNRIPMQQRHQQTKNNKSSATNPTNPKK